MSARVKSQNKTVTGELPHDRPFDGRPHRLYVATTNHCNRECSWCSTYSSPRGQTWLTVENYVAGFPAKGDFELQLEGGEPTIHPDFFEQVRIAAEHPRCRRLIVVTNGVAVPRSRDALRAWLSRLGDRFTLKLSVNHHLLERDAGLLSLATLLNEEVPACDGDCQLVLNVRLRKGAEGDDGWIVDVVTRAGLLSSANVFFLQRYGLAESRSEWESPFLVGENFSMMTPDGRVWGADLIKRSEAMGRMP